MPALKHFLLAAAVPVALGATPLHAQAAPVACESQQSLEQVLGSDGEVMPDDCRPLSFATLEGDHGRLCQIDFSRDGGIIDDLRAVAAPQEWWVLCDALAEAAQER